MKGLGYCDKHYQMFKKTGSPLPAPKEVKQCSVDGCLKPHFSKGFCGAHYARAHKNNGDPGSVEIRKSGLDGCSVENCERDHYGKGLCNMHYQQAKVAARPKKEKKRPAPKMPKEAKPKTIEQPKLPKTVALCAVEGCDRIQSRNGYCFMHSERVRKNGEPGEAAPAISYTYNASIFTNEDDVSYYLLGCFMSDGHIIEHGTNSKSCGLTSQDRDWLEPIAQLVCPEKPIRERARNENGATIYDVSFHSLAICEWLISKGCTPRKSLTLEYPIGMPDKFLPDWLRGMIDGDGSVALYDRYRKDRDSLEKDRSCCLYSSSKLLVDVLSEKLTSIGFETRIHVRIFGDRPIEDRIITSRTPNYRLYFKNAENTYRFLKMVYYEGNRIAMPRKAQGALNIITDWERPYFC